MSEHGDGFDIDPVPPADGSAGVPAHLPVLPLRDTVLFPHSFMPLAVARTSSVRLIEDVMAGGQIVGVFTQRDASVEEPGQDDLFPVGTASRIHKMFALPDGSLRLIVQGLSRVGLGVLTQSRPYLTARPVPADSVALETDRLEIDALVRNIRGAFQQIVTLSPLLSEDLATLAATLDDPGRLADFIASNLTTMTTATRQEVLETLDLRARLAVLNRVLLKEREVLEIGSRIQSQVQSEVGRNQREYLLREQLKAIQQELGEGDGHTREIDELRGRIEGAGLPADVKRDVLRELDRASRMPSSAAEYIVSRTYVDWVVSLPWSTRTDDLLDLVAARRALDAGHAGLVSSKERILEYLAVRTLNPGVTAPILCLLGPPGVGKTSLARAIAQALGRRFVRVSLGGMRDEAEIRGHRRTYVGALPGQVLQGLRRVGSRNPVCLLDEIDKIGADFRGDPAAALLEVLDPEQNVSFRDHYLDVPFDLSEVLFITTANTLDPVPPALRDRMEVLEIQGYTEEEKLAILRRHLVPEQVRQHGLTSDHISVTDDALIAIVRGYTREAGVRSLERQVAAVCRKVARRRAEGETAADVVTPQRVIELLGAPRFLDEDMASRTSRPGVALGLAWTPAGGDLLIIEASRMPGTGTLTLTGQLGDVMKESARAALSWCRAHGTMFGAEPGFFAAAEIHVHVPAGAIPKDGPSAGITMATALMSELTGRPVRGDVAMTGEITLSGLVLPVGGIKEKVLAARRAGIRTLILPERNERHVAEEIGGALLAETTIHYVRTVDEVMRLVLQPSAPTEGVLANAGRAASGRPPS